MKIIYEDGMVIDLTAAEFKEIIANEKEVADCKSQENIEEVEKAPEKEAPKYSVEDLFKKAPSPKRTKAPLDDGKIVALRKAGWEWSKIRDELDYTCSIQTIVNHYNSAVGNIDGGSDGKKKG